MKDHTFIFTPGKWLGEGTIKLNMAKEEMRFFTRWTIGEKDQSGIITTSQEIEISGIGDLMKNEFLFSKIKEDSFAIELENQSLGKVIGKGVITKKIIAWEFRQGNLGFEGLELYELDGKDKYKVHAEYATTEDFRTIIHGKIWRKLDE